MLSVAARGRDDVARRRPTRDVQRQRLLPRQRVMAGRQLYGSVRRMGQELAVAGAPGLMLSGAGRHHRHGDRLLLLLGQS